MIGYGHYPGFGDAASDCAAKGWDYDPPSDTCEPPPAHPDNPYVSGNAPPAGGSSAPVTADAGGGSGTLPWLLGGAVVLGIIYFVAKKA